MANTEIMTLNMGPQHPSTHGVLRLVVELDGEVIQSITPHIGYLHRGVEKLSEHRTYHQTIPLTDRLDYLAPMHNNLGYVLAVEKLLDLEVPERAQTVRVIMAELTRIMSHLVWLACHALDIGAMTVFIYCFREREEILKIFEDFIGARLTAHAFRIGGLWWDAYPEFEARVREFLKILPERLDEYETLLTNNRIWIGRTKGVGVISLEDMLDLGVEDGLFKEQENLLDECRRIVTRPGSGLAGSI